MTIQTDYAARMGLPSPGTIQGSDFNSGTGICETVAGIGFGLAVSQGAADQGVVLGGASKFLGITIKDVTLVHATPDKYAQYDNVGYIKRGRVLVTASVAVAAGDAVTYDSTTGVLSNTGGVSIPGARWATSAAAGGAAEVELVANAGS